MATYIDADFAPQAMTDPLSKVLNRHLVDGVKAGAHRGLKPIQGSAGYITITSGAAHTREGVRIEKTADQEDLLSVTPAGAGVYRIDRIVLRHTYTQTYPNVPEVYEIVLGDEGAAGAVAPPACPADGLTLGFGVISDEATDYELLVPSGRDGESLRRFTLGDGDAAVGDFNGWAGWLDLIDIYRDVPIEVLVSGTIIGANTFVIPSKWRLRGLLGAAVLSSDASKIVAFEGRASASGATQSSTNYLDDPTGDFTHLSTNAVIMITDTGGAGTYLIGERVSDTRLALVRADGSTPTFVGASCHYTVIAQTPGLWDLFAVAQSAGARIVDFSYTGHVDLRNVVSVAGAAADSGFYSTTSNYALVDRCRCEGSMTYCLRDGGYSASARINRLWADAGDVLWNTAGGLLTDIKTPGTVSAGGTSGSGGVGWPFSAAHYPNGTLRPDTVDTDQLVDDAVTGDKVADEAIDTNHLADGAVDGDKIDGQAVAPEHLDDRSLWIRASFSVNLGATDAYTTPIAAEVQKNKAGTLETVSYSGGSSFLATDGSYPWLVRKDDTGVYQVRPPCTIGSGTIVPSSSPVNACLSVIPIGASRIFSATWDNTNKLWEIAFIADDGSPIDTNFQWQVFNIT